MSNNILKEIQNRDGVYEHLREVSSIKNKSLSDVIVDILENDCKQVDVNDYDAKLIQAKLKR